MMAALIVIFYLLNKKTLTNKDKSESENLNNTAEAIKSAVKDGMQDFKTGFSAELK